jgi:hypothetical protein
VDSFRLIHNQACELLFRASFHPLPSMATIAQWLAILERLTDLSDAAPPAVPGDVDAPWIAFFFLLGSGANELDAAWLALATASAMLALMKLADADSICKHLQHYYGLCATGEHILKHVLKLPTFRTRVAHASKSKSHRQTPEAVADDDMRQLRITCRTAMVVIVYREATIACDCVAVSDNVALVHVLDGISNATCAMRSPSRVEKQAAPTARVWMPLIASDLGRYV